MKRINPYNILGAIFGVIGLIFAVTGVIILINTKEFVNDAVQVQGKISRIDSSIGNDGETDYTVFVTYTYNDEKYKNIRLNEYSSSMYEGKSIELYIDKENPEKAKTKSMVYVLPIVFISLGGVFAVVGIILLSINIRAKKRKENLKKTGEKIYAEIQGGFVETSYTLKGKHPYRLECVYYDNRSGQPVICTSDVVWESPDSYIGKQVAVYVDRKDRSRYVVDTDNIYS